ncbi:hypothetical protein EIB75_07815 [Epilithonimonas vandammei]|uniref:DUF4393 domain-containing protein n=1 Tax=Epilithonimonas vandammei TaxID=2487072 RepID=A0A3G8ZCN9_9FLAO|nr:hypothetical protein [Epilithonimonas vandammei]AZI55152.1 hypothetical protein EIB75_07815 [Epilithonimonas vandammei]
MKLDKSLVESIKSNGIVKITLDIGEAIIDSNLEDGILKDIPFIGSIINLNKGFLSIQDRIFSKKMISFLYQLRDIPEDKRINAIQKIEDSKEERIKAGEKIIYLIDKADDHIKAEFIGILFSEYVSENLSYEEFKKCSEIINKTYLDDLKWFLKSDYVRLTMEEASDLIPSGLFDMPYTITIENAESRYNDSPYVIEGYNKVEINPYAEKMRLFLKNRIVT